MVSNIPINLSINYKEELIRYFKDTYDITPESINFLFDLKYLNL